MHAATLTIETIVAFVILHLAVAAWTGVLAARWKRRNGWRWFVSALLAPGVAVAVLAMLHRPRTGGIEADMEMQYLDGTRLLR